ncbi:hypothetical protein [Sporosarcina sp. NPDC096371]|uniref:hypothetical protein n=1 Tax=Sporosarcina sp. NPDC096371 TaxID=3364530 RepID=UPI0037F5A351
MGKKRTLGLTVLICLFLMTLIFPYSFFSMYKPITFNKADTNYLKDYRNELKVLRNVNDQNESSGRVEYYTDFILNTYEMDLMTADSVKVSKSDLNGMLNSIRSLRDLLLIMVFKEELSSESKKYLEQSLGWCLRVEENIVRIKSFPYYTRFQLVTIIENIQNDFQMSFDMYTHFYEEYYGLKSD